MIRSVIIVGAAGVTGIVASVQALSGGTAVVVVFVLFVLLALTGLVSFYFQLKAAQKKIYDIEAERLADKSQELAQSRAYSQVTLDSLDNRVRSIEKRLEVAPADVMAEVKQLREDFAEFRNQ